MNTRKLLLLVSVALVASGCAYRGALALKGEPECSALEAELRHAEALAGGLRVAAAGESLPQPKAPLKTLVLLNNTPATKNLALQSAERQRLALKAQLAEGCPG